MDHNANANRPQKINRDGTPAFRTKVDRARRKEVAVKVRVKKDYSFRNEVRNLSAVALIINDL